MGSPDLREVPNDPLTLPESPRPPGGQDKREAHLREVPNDPLTLQKSPRPPGGQDKRDTPPGGRQRIVDSAGKPETSRRSA
jgi:hypothetical protein